MPWTPWIKIEKADTSKKDVRKLYKYARNPITKKLSDLTRLTSLTPAFSEKLFMLSLTVFQNRSGLNAREKEIAALVTSSFNGCVH
jgi:hypothetical protein